MGGVKGGVSGATAVTWSQSYAPPPALLPAVVLGLTSALRSANVFGLRWQDLDMNAGTIHLDPERMKTRTEMTIPLSRSFRRLLAEIPVGGPEAPILGVENLGRSFSSAVRRAKLKRVTFHTLRKTAGTLCRRAGIPLETVKALGGWSTKGDVFLEHYRCVAFEELRKAVDVLDGIVERALAEGDEKATTVKPAAHRLGF
jgi:integrase